jgi:hypothetical protein
MAQAIIKEKIKPMKMRNKLLAAAAGAGAAAAGYYFYTSKNAKKNREAVGKWAIDFKKDVVKQAKQIKNIDRSTLMGIVDGVTKAYEGVRGMDRKDLMKAANELKDNWQKLRVELQQTGVAASREARKTIKDNSASMKKTAKKVAKKVRKAIR